MGGILGDDDIRVDQTAQHHFHHIHGFTIGNSHTIYKLGFLAYSFEQVTDLPAKVSSSDLLQWVARPSVPLYRANVWKRRFRFALQGCRAELDQLLVNGAAVESVAVESEDAQAVLEVRAALRLEDCENQSYPLLLSRILGLTPLPHEEDYG